MQHSLPFMSSARVSGLQQSRASAVPREEAAGTCQEAGHFSGDWTRVSVTKAWHAISTEVVYRFTDAKDVFTPRAYA